MLAAGRSPRHASALSTHYIARAIWCSVGRGHVMPLLAGSVVPPVRVKEQTPLCDGLWETEKSGCRGPGHFTAYLGSGMVSKPMDG